MWVTVAYQKATANYVPAAAVIRRWQALSGIIGRKGCVPKRFVPVFKLPLTETGKPDRAIAKLLAQK